MDRYMGILGIFVLIGLAFLMSNNKRKIKLRTVIAGLGLQIGMGVLFLSWDRGNQFIQWVAEKVTVFLFLADHGTKFLFGKIADPEYIDVFGFQFAFRILPIIIFFASFMAILYYLGVMQKIVKVFAWVMKRVMNTSGAESLSCSANIFVGQTEAPLLIRPFLGRCTMSELCAVMVGGFGTVAGTVLAGYIGMGIPAHYLIVASVMSAPACLMIAKIIYPETEISETSGNLKLPKIEAGSNVLDAASKGVTDGLHLALNVAAMLVGFIALIALVDKILGIGDRLIDGRLLGGALMQSGEYAGYFPGSLRSLFGTILYPLTYVMGFPGKDAFDAANLLGTKISINEFVAYAKLSAMLKESVLSPKAQIMATFMLCGFANFSSIGIQIGGISALAPERRSDLSKLALKAMFGGAIASCLTATIAGILLG